MTRSFDGRGVILADFDLDGRMDVLITVQGNRPFLARNRFVPTAAVPAEPSFIGLPLAGDGRAVNTDAVGARVRVTASPGSGVRAIPPLHYEISAGNGFAGQSTSWIVAGLGDHRGRVDVAVRWTDGREERFGGLAPGMYYRIAYRGGIAPVVRTPSGVPTSP